MNEPAPDLRHRRILVLEDDFYLASDLEHALEAAGATVIGPFPDEAQATRALDGALPDCAFIDINLGHGPSYEVPRALAARAVPFVFLTGYDASAIIQEFDTIPRLGKPVDARIAIDAARAMMRAEEATAR